MSSRAPMYLIYSFHMPAFVFLAGITAKSTRLPERVLTFLVLLFTVLPLLWEMMWVFDLNPDYDLLTPFWYTWFLLSMACWIITVPFINDSHAHSSSPRWWWGSSAAFCRYSIWSSRPHDR